MKSSIDPNVWSVAEEAFHQWGIPGLVIGLLQDGTTDIRAFGIASVETGYPLLPESAFRLASITKPFVATLVALLIQEGLVNPDQPIVDYLPNLRLPDAGEADITVRHLLTHTSGLDSEIPVNLSSYGRGDDALERLVGSRPPVRRWMPPGQVFSYSNFNYWLLGAIAGRCTSGTFEEAIGGRLLTPFGLERTFLFVDEAIAHPVAVGHHPDYPGSRNHLVSKSGYSPARVRVPSGGLISTAGDLLIFARQYLAAGSPQVLSHDLIAAVVQGEAQPGWGGRYGWGWCTESLAGQEVIKHDGGAGGFSTTLRIVPSRGFALVVLTNSARSTGMAHIADWAMAEFAGLHWRRPNAIQAEQGALTAVAGRYQSITGSALVEPQENGLRLELTERDPVTGEKSPPSIEWADPVGGLSYCMRGGELDGMVFDFLALAGGPGTPPTHIRLGGLAERAAISDRSTPLSSTGSRAHRERL